MNIERPMEGQVFALDKTISFGGRAGDGVASVQLTADPNIALGEATLADGCWTFSRRFSGPGNRTITATGRDAAGQVVATTAVHILLQVSELHGYLPPPSSLPLLGRIANQLEGATRVPNHFIKGGKNVFRLPDGQLYFESQLDLDSDGSRWALQDGTGQTDTTLHQPNGKPVDADAVPFYVLPGGDFVRPFGIKIGDIAAVIFRNRIEFAVFADRGPKLKLGEGSIALHRSLGHEAIRNNRFHDEAIDDGVITIVFPGSGDGTPQTPDTVRQKGRTLFAALGGVV